MLRHRFTAWTFAVVTGVAIIVASCSESATSPISKEFTVTDSGYSSFDTIRLRNRLRGYATSSISDSELRALKFVCEEEKLVHDLYVDFSARYNKLIFMNIAQSELTHANAVLQLLQRYQIADPSQGIGPGVFADTMLQQLLLVSCKGQSQSEVLENQMLVCLNSYPKSECCEGS